MLRRSWVRFLILTAIFFLVALLAGCAEEGPSAPTPEEQDHFSVAPIFRDLYNKMGGEEVLGPAISMVQPVQGGQCQFTEKVLICDNYLATDMNRFFFYPLGERLELSKDDFSKTVPQFGKLVVDGVEIYSGFVPLYEKLHGALFVGRPLTAVQYNFGQQRIEQHFQNMGFYHNFNEAPGVVHLLSYGAYFCGKDCRSPVQAGSTIFGSDVTVPVLDAAVLERIGGFQVLGKPLTRPYVSSNNAWEQVFENGVAYVPSDSPTLFRLRPLSESLGYITQAPVQKQWGIDQNMIFYPLEGDAGHHVPVVFDRFIAQHGGIEIFGKPISEVYELRPGIYAVTFEGAVVSYDPSQPETERVKLEPLGEQYLQQIDPNVAVKLAYPKDAILLQVNEAEPQISSQSSQTIQLVVLERKTQKPMVNVEANLVVSLPDGTELKEVFPPTGTDGISRVTLEPMTRFSSGSVISYQVCLNVPSDEPVCMAESYLIWDAEN